MRRFGKNYKMTESFFGGEVTPNNEYYKSLDQAEPKKKRILIFSLLGSVIIIGALITVIVLVAEGKNKPNNMPNLSYSAKEIYPHYNPFFVDGVQIESQRLMKIHLINKRKELEGKNPIYVKKGNVPIVKATPENYEPERLRMDVEEFDDHMVRFHFVEPGARRWEVPYFNEHSDPYAEANKDTDVQSNFKLVNFANNSFQWYYRGMIGKPLLDTTDCRLQFFDKYIEFEAVLIKGFIFGMGERMESFNLREGNYSLWNRQITNDGNYYDPEDGIHGSHPFFLGRAKDYQSNGFVGLFMRNSNAMLFSTWRKSTGDSIINYKMVGGTIDLYLFHAKDPQHVLRKYHTLIGKPYLPPVWGMGLQQAREDYGVKKFEEIIKKHNEHKIPIDTLWADAIMNDDYKTFTVDPKRFAGIKEIVSKMHSETEGIDMHFVAIANPGLAKDNNYKYYVEARSRDCLIKSATTHGGPYIGKTFAGDSAWLDFFSYNSTLIWATGLQDLYEATLFDGIWLNANEIYNLCNGECLNMESVADPKENHGIPDPYHNATEFDYLQYRPTKDPLERRTLPMSAYHTVDDRLNKQFNTHNLFGLQQSYATYLSLSGLFEGKRFLIASRSTWPGSGHFTSHWLAATNATWTSMRSSITGILNFNLFGIPHVGAPIGGFNGDCDPELLTRWFGLGAYSPLMLSYSSSNSNNKEAYANPDFIPYIKNVLLERYAILRFMYTKMFEAHMWGGAVVHPSFFDFPEDEELYKQDVLDESFMWAHSLLVIPALIRKATSVRAYVPNWNWYDLRTLRRVAEYWPSDSGSYMMFEQPLGTVTVLIKGGSIIPFQHSVEEAKIMNTKDLELIPTRIIVALDHDGKASGTMVVDNERVRPHPDPKSNTYSHYNFTTTNQTFRVEMLADLEYKSAVDEMWELVILGLYDSQVDFVCMTDKHMNKEELDFLRISDEKSLSIHRANSAKIPMWNVESIVWGTDQQPNPCKSNSLPNPRV